MEKKLTEKGKHLLASICWREFSGIGSCYIHGLHRQWFELFHSLVTICPSNTFSLRNRMFFDACDGIFTNYNWTEQSLEWMKDYNGAQGRQADIYIGVDVFARGKVVGGMFETNKVNSISVCRFNDVKRLGLSGPWQCRTSCFCLICRRWKSFGSTISLPPSLRQAGCMRLMTTRVNSGGIKTSKVLVPDRNAHINYWLEKQQKKNVSAYCLVEIDVFFFLPVGSGLFSQTTFMSIGQPHLYPSSHPSARALGRLSTGEDRYWWGLSHRHSLQKCLDWNAVARLCWQNKLNWIN